MKRCCELTGRASSRGIRAGHRSEPDRSLSHPGDGSARTFLGRSNRLGQRRTGTRIRARSWSSSVRNDRKEVGEVRSPSDRDRSIRGRWIGAQLFRHSKEFRPQIRERCLIGSRSSPNQYVDGTLPSSQVRQDIDPPDLLQPPSEEVSGHGVPAVAGDDCAEAWSAR